MVNMTIVNNEQCVVGATLWYVWYAHTMTADEPNTQGVHRVTCVLAGLRAHYTAHTTPKQKKKEEERRKGEERREEERRGKSSVRTVEALVSLTLRRATTQHKQQKEERTGEQR